VFGNCENIHVKKRGGEKKKRGRIFRVLDNALHVMKSVK
jgi:hypothetical protein